MPKLFNRILTFKVEGEIYDKSTKPEDIIKNYSWHYKDYSDDGDKLFIVAEHKDNRGKITKITRLASIQKTKKPDTEYFII